ncbi:MAG: OB-fold domain-containing protein [Vannielia sp.]|uniref:Zn-ribbon domain-containing OB-fold protein n=1 Tax=Vannielia sp. TaxID=2813045 RepID=UPI003B8B6890
MNEIEQSPRAAWEAHARDGKLAYQWSPDAGRAVWQPRLLCPFGGRAPLEWRVSAGRGVIHSITLTHPVKGAPYTIALIDMDEGFRMMSRVEGADGAPSEIGRRVVLRFEAGEGEAPPVPVFDMEPGR